MKKILSFVACLLIGGSSMAVAQVVATEEPVAAEENATQEEVKTEETVTEVANSTEVTAPADSTITEMVQVEDSVLVSDIDTELIEEYEDEEPEFLGDPNEGIAKTWEYRLSGVFNTSTGTSAITSDESVGVEFTFGYNFSANFFAGVSTGYLHNFGGTSGVPAPDAAFPFVVDLQYRWNLARRLSLYLEGRAGIVLNATNDVEVWRQDEDNKRIPYNFQYPNYQYYDIQPGVIYHPSQVFDVRFSVGYGYARPGKETKYAEDRTYDETILAFKVGFARRF